LVVSRADRVLKEIEEESERNPLIIIGPKRGAILDDVVTKYKPKTILEIGTLVGYSAIRMGRHLPPGGGMICVEKDEEIAAIATKNIANAGLSSTIQVRVGEAQIVIPTLAGPFDMVFIDAEKNEYMVYLRLVEEKLKKGSVVVADNVKSAAEEMRDYLDHVRNSGRYSSSYIGSENVFYPEGDAVEVSVKL
jgi:predicted O-methyltransferase YrrM